MTRSDPLLNLRHDRTAPTGLDLPPPETREDGSMIVWVRGAVFGDMDYPNLPHKRERVDRESFDEEAMRSLRLRPVVWEHDHDPINPGNVNAIRIGQTGEDIRFDAEGVIFPVVIDTEVGLRVVKDYKIREVSLEYDVLRLDKAPDGVMVQRQRRHRALAFTTRARAGRRAVARVDREDPMEAETIKALIAAVREGQTVEQLKGRLDAMEKEADKERDDMAGMKAKYDALTEKHDELQAKYDALLKKHSETSRGDSEDFAKAVARHSKLVEQADLLGVDVSKASGTSAVRQAIVERLDSKIADLTDIQDTAAIDAVISVAADAAKAKAKGTETAIKSLALPSGNGTDRRDSAGLANVLTNRYNPTPKEA